MDSVVEVNITSDGWETQVLINVFGNYVVDNIRPLQVDSNRTLTELQRSDSTLFIGTDDTVSYCIDPIRGSRPSLCVAPGQL